MKLHKSLAILTAVLPVALSRAINPSHYAGYKFHHYNTMHHIDIRLTFTALPSKSMLLGNFL